MTSSSIVVVGVIDFCDANYRVSQRARELARALEKKSNISERARRPEDKNTPNMRLAS